MQSQLNLGMFLKLCWLLLIFKSVPARYTLDQCKGL